MSDAAGVLHDHPTTGVGAVIVSHSRPDLAARCAANLAEQIGADNVVIVANLPGTAAALEGTSVRVLGAVEAPLGYGANANRGVSLLEHELVLIANDDVVPHVGSISALVSAMRDDPRLAVVAPRLVDEDGAEIRGEYPFPNVRREAVQAMIAPRPVERWLLRLVGRGAVEQWVQGAVLLVRRAAFDAVGGFDERFFLNSEEVDLARRLHDAGWRLRVVPAASMIHIGGASIEDDDDRLYRRERRRYIRHHWSRAQRVALHPVMALVYAWNAAYTGLRCVTLPSRRREHLDRCRRKWTKRPAW